MKDKEQTILVTGAGGQLGSELKNIATAHPQYYFLFTTREELPIDDSKAVHEYFERHKISFCINCAAYTAVDKAETEVEETLLINATAVGYLASACRQHKATLIHLSTDYVFDGTATEPYKESDHTSPVNAYGAGKLKGEELAIANNPATIIIRTSWLYSQYGHNFVKTMLRLLKEKESINVVNDQLGCPTNAADLAEAIIHMIGQLPTANYQLPTVFNYSNTGITTWFEFASAIKERIQSKCSIHPVPTSQYPTVAKRPHYSVLDTTKIRETFHINIPNWKDSLHKCLEVMN